MTTKELCKKANSVLRRVKNVRAHERSDADYGSMEVCEPYVEVDFSARKVIGPCPVGDKEAKDEWRRRYGDLHVAPIAAAEEALKKAGIEFTEVGNGKDFKKLVLTGVIQKHKV